MDLSHCVQWCHINTLRPRQDGRHFPDDIFKCIFLNENKWISLKISLKFVLKGPINDIPALVQIMARRRPGDKPLSEPMMVYRRVFESLGLNELSHHWIRYWLDTYSVLSYHLNQYGLIVSWTLGKIQQWNLNQNIKLSRKWIWKYL